MKQTKSKEILLVVITLPNSEIEEVSQITITIVLLELCGILFISLN